MRNALCLYLQTVSWDLRLVRFGSLAVIKADISLMTDFGGKAAIKSAKNHDIEGPLSARSGRTNDVPSTRIALASTLLNQHRILAAYNVRCSVVVLY